MEIFGGTIGVTNDDVLVNLGDYMGWIFVPAGEHLRVLHYEDLRDGSDYFTRPVVDGDTEVAMGYVYDSPSYEYVGSQCHIKCPRRHKDGTQFSFYPHHGDGIRNETLD